MGSAWWPSRGRGFGSLIIALVGATSLLAASPASAGVTRTEFFGIVEGPVLDEPDMATMKSLRVQTDRFLLNWGWVEPHKGSYKWGPADHFIGDLASHGVRAAPSVWGNPNWIPGSSSTPPIGGTPSQQQWRIFLKALVDRYGRGGEYWGPRYHQQFGATAKPLPITSWQIWNEPNISKYFAPKPSPGQYARLLQISYLSIKHEDHKAQVALAGLAGRGDMAAVVFLKKLYAVPGIRAYFDATALHPYMSTLDQIKQTIKQVRTAMVSHHDAATPLWISELAWGSDPPDKAGINKGRAGQARLLTRAFKLILANRKAWNVQHLFWYLLRDPADPVAVCSFCASAGLLSSNRIRKPSYNAFKAIVAEKVAPEPAIIAGPAQGRTISDPTPTFRFTSNEPGSTFRCRFDAKPLAACSSPLTPEAALSNRHHTFSVRAIDAPGNVSPFAARSFMVKAR
jgi:hypothetical protein